MKQDEFTCVLDIIVTYLVENGYGGLYHEDGCICRLGDMCPCGELSLFCKPWRENENN